MKMAKKKADKEENQDSTPLVKQPKLDSSDDDPEEVFEVEKIIGERKTRDGKTQYKVHWRGYDTDEETWENESNLDCPEIIEQFKTPKIKKKPGPKPKNGRAITNDQPSAPQPTKKAEKIVGLHTLKDGKREVLVRWKDLPETHDSWEPEEDLFNTEVHTNFLIKEKENLAKKEARMFEEEETLVED